MDFVETIRVETIAQLSTFALFYKAVLKFPYIISDIYPYIFLMASGITIWGLLKTQQITILKSIGYKEIDIITPLIKSGLYVGLIWMFVLHPISCSLYFKVMNPELVETIHKSDAKIKDVWIHQQIQQQDVLTHIGEIKNKICSNIGIYFLDKDGKINRKILASQAVIDDDAFLLKQVILISENNKKIEKFKSASFKNGLSKKHLLSTIKQPNFMGIYDLISLLRLRYNINIDYSDIIIRLNSIFSIVLLTGLMPVFASICCIVHSRQYSSILAFFLLSASSIILYFIFNVLRVLASGKLLSILLFIWLPIIALGGTGLYLLFVREKKL